MSGDEGLVAWLREAILERRALAEAVFSAAGLFSSAPQRSPELGHQVFDGSGVVVTHDRSVVLPSDVATHIAANDPRDVIARCEAELGILDLHQPTWNGCGDPWPECRECGPNNDDSGIFAVPGEGESFWPCATVRLLGTGYKHRPGYLEEWAP